MSNDSRVARLELLKERLEAVQDPTEQFKIAYDAVGEGVAIGTSGQLTGAVMIDHAVRGGVRPRVFSIDTLRLFRETYVLFQEIQQKYGVEVEWYRPDPQELAKMIRNHGEYLFFDSKAKQEYCCDVRKVHPNERALQTIDVWFTGLRRDQSNARTDTSHVSWVLAKGADGGLRKILKVAALFDWTEEQLRTYAEANDVPVHPLLQFSDGPWRYESVGCQICTTPIGEHESRRAGRWRWFNQMDQEEDKKECGIHLEYSPLGD